MFILTSATLNVSDLARGLSRAEQLIGVHFIPPVTEVDVVEVSHNPFTSKETIELTERFLNRLGKKPIYINESPGLVNPRALITLINEGAYLVDEGVANIYSVEQILKASWGNGTRMAEMADRMGLDTILRWMEQLHTQFGDRYAPAPLIRRFVRQGRLGVKTGQGFLTYTKDGLVDYSSYEQEEQ